MKNTIAQNTGKKAFGVQEEDMSFFHEKDLVVTDFLDRVNRVPVSVDLLVDALAMHAKMPVADRGDYRARACRTLDLLDRKGLCRTADDLHILAMLIDLRLSAVARLEVMNRVLKGWSIPAGEFGVSSLHLDVIRAAAEEPLIEDGEGQACFNPDSFQQRLLAIATPAGRA